MIHALLIALALIGQTAKSDDTRGLTILSFRATWCGPCKTMAPRIASLEKAGYPVREIDVDVEKDMAARYEVGSIPCLVLIDRDGNQLKRIIGVRPTNEIAAWYTEEFKRLGPIAEPESDPQAARPPPAATDNSWLTACRIVNISVKAGSEAPACYGSGTVIGSTDDEAIILTCAHIFSPGDGPKIAAKDFAGKIKINLSDGTPVSDGEPREPHTGFLKDYPGTPIDYDFGLDVGLVRVKTHDHLPFSRVVPPSWTPKAGMKMHVVGCAAAQHPTRFETTIRNPDHGAKGFAYRAIQCERQPAQGRSGGGLFTSDGLLAGVTDFQSLEDDSGLYAHPQSIYAILDRNDLSDLYREVVQSSRPKPKVTPAPPVDTEVDRDSKLRKMVEETCKLFHRKPAPAGPVGPAGPQGEQGPVGPAGKDGVDGKPGANGKDGSSGTATPVDLSAILKRLQALEEEFAKPITVEMKIPGGKTVSHDFYRKPNKDGKTGIGAGYPNMKLGFDFSDFAVPSKTPPAK